MAAIYAVSLCIRSSPVMSKQPRQFMPLSATARMNCGNDMDAAAFDGDTAAVGCDMFPKDRPQP